jgi:hypothetical protein
MLKSNVPVLRTITVTASIVGVLSLAPTLSLANDFCTLENDGLTCGTNAGKVKDIFLAYVNGQFCTLNAESARFACINDVEEERWLGMGNCLNSTDPLCFPAVAEETSEDYQECAEQFDARIEVCAALGEAIYDPVVNPANFVDPTDIGSSITPNPYFPLVPGTTWIYEGGDEKITVTVTEDTKEILGITCAVVQDVVEEEGEIIEDTLDWYAQDVEGNVWYFGEIAKNFEDGELTDIDGSWTAGVEGAKIGIIMPIAPEVGQVYRQEFALDEAEDMGEILSLTETESVPGASCTDNCLKTRDFTPLEPDVEEHKYYAPDIGLILEVDLENDERVELIEMIKP